MTDSNAFIHPDPVTERDGEPALVFQAGAETLVLRGTASRNYFGGWRAEFLYTGFAPILVIQLVHPGGSRVVWHASSDGVRLGDKVADLSAHHRRLLARAAAPIIERALRLLVEAPRPSLAERERGFLRLDTNCTHELVELCQDRLIWQVETLSLDSMPARMLAPAADDAPPLILRREHLRRGLTRSLQDQLVADVARGAIGFTCPVTGTEIQCQGSLCFDDFHFAYRFTDATGRLVFYVIAGHEHSHFYAVYVPALALLFAAPGREGTADGAARFLPPWLPRHLLRFGLAFERYLAATPRGITSPLRAPPWTHIGHQLWNELTGIERYLSDAGEHAPQPEWVVPDGSGPIELYGPVERLFPPLAGRVRRGLRHADDLIRHAYGEGRIVARVTRDFVSEGMRERLLRFAADQAADQAGEGARPDPLAGDAPVILLGLRLENRTLVDLGTFYERLIAAVLARHPAIRFVVDGHNASAAGAGKYHSHGEGREQARETERAELALVERLRRRTPAKVVSAVGLTVPDTLLLIARSTLFIAPWGAGLAKYRWACNKPGYVFTNRWNLQHRHDLRIYDTPALMEAPAEMLWVRPDQVTDVPIPPRVVGGAVQPQWFNFSMDTDAVIADFMAMVQRFTG